MSESCGSHACGEGEGCASCSDQEKQKAQKLRMSLAKIKNVIVVMSGKGGVGKSTVSANLAVSLSMEGKNVGLLDVDFHGPSIPTILGLTEEKVLGGDEKLMPVEIGTLKVMSLGFLVEDRDAAVVWRGPMKAGVIQQLLSDVAWDELDYLIVDCPPGTGDEPLSVCQTIPSITGAVIVTTPQQVAIADVRRSISFCGQLDVKVLGVIENMSGFVCPKCGEVTEIFKTGGGEKMAADMKVPFLGRIPIDPSVAESGDSGKAYVHHYAHTPTAAAFSKAIGPILSLATEPVS